MTLYKWSQTAATNGTADSTCPFPEGMAPSAVNDGVRGAMAAVAKYRDDTAGAILTAGTSTAYTVLSYEGFDTLPHLSGQVIAFSPHTTNAATVTLNVDSLGAKPLRSSPGVELQSGVLVQGTPYVALYNNSDGAFYLFGVGAAPGIPLAAGMDYWGTTTPGSAFAFPAGQAISRTTYATLFTIMGTTFGVGDGSTTFNIPDIRGRVVAGVDNMGGSAAGRLTSASSMGTGLLGQAGGAETETLTLAQLPTGITSTASNTISVSSSGNFLSGTLVNTGVASGGNAAEVLVSSSGSSGVVSSSGSNTIAVTSNNTGGGAHPIIMPAICANRILRIV